jgi:hypothetical protein
LDSNGFIKEAKMGEIMCAWLIVVALLVSFGDPNTTGENRQELLDGHKVSKQTVRQISTYMSDEQIEKGLLYEW